MGFEFGCPGAENRKGAGGVDGMEVRDLEEYLKVNRNSLTNQVLHSKYIPQPIRGKEIPKGN